MVLRYVLFGVATGLAPAAAVSTSPQLSGTVTVAIEDLLVKQVNVALFRMRPGSEAGLSKRRLLGADVPGPLRAPPADYVVEAIGLSGVNSAGLTVFGFQFQDVAHGNYTVVAFEPAGEDRGSWLDFAPPRRQALGIHQDADGCLAESFSEGVCAKVVQVTGSGVVGGIDVTLRAPHLMPQDARVAHGSVRRAPGGRATVLHVHGNAYERGFAHGLLLARQIIDVFDFFLIEDMVRSKKFYESEFVPALARLARPSAQFESGARGVLAGMKASNQSMRTCLGRDLGLLDIVALNTYADSGAWTASGAAGGSACSQFVFYGDAVAEELGGGALAGRNMDGENDVRKVTVNNLVLHAVEPTEPGLQRYVHVMWPGFLGASSGFNEKGRYMMENAGCSPPGPAATGSPLLRDVISNVLSDASLGADAAPEEVEASILSFKSDAGGSCVNGCILMNAQPYRPGRTAGFVFEGDRDGGKMRLPGDVPPVVERGIMATNHNMDYATAPGQPKQCDGTPAGFSSLARYFTGQSKVESWAATGQLRVGVGEMRQLLQAVSHRTTEHSIIFQPNSMTFELAVASPNGMWEAPYRAWDSLSFEEMFGGGRAVSRDVLFL